MYFHIASNSYHDESRGQPFTVDGIQYPGDWLKIATAENKAAAGFVEVETIGTPADPETHYTDYTFEGSIRRVVNIPKSAEQLAQVDSTKRDAAIAQVREMREKVLNRLAGIALSAQIDGDTVLVDAYKQARTSLLDITKDLPTDYAGAVAVMMSRYQQLVITAITASIQLEKAFAEVDL